MDNRSQVPPPIAAPSSASTKRGERSPVRRGAGASGADLQQLTRLAGVGELLAEVVHEVRNGLVSIKTFVQLLPEHRGDAEFEARFREVTRGEFDRIERLLAAVLDQASGQGSLSGEARETPAADPLRAIEGVSALLKLRADKCGVTLVNACREGGPLSIADDLLRQVLLNLVLNAFSVSERGDEVRVSTRQHGPFLEIRIEDHGPGVERADRERIFEPFFTTRSESTGGLGLAISRRLVEDAGGTLTVRDRAGGGSCFRIRIPFRVSERSDPGPDPRLVR